MRLEQTDGLHRSGKKYWWTAVIVVKDSEEESLVSIASAVNELVWEIGLKLGEKVAISNYTPITLGEKTADYFFIGLDVLDGEPSERNTKAKINLIIDIWRLALEKGFFPKEKQEKIMKQLFEISES